MIKDILKLGMLILLILLLQILVFNSMSFFSYGTPFPYIYLLLFLPIRWRPTMLLFLSFFLGLLIDVFSNTPGMHASATLCIGLFQPYLFKKFLPDSEYEISVASLNTFGFKNFSLYVLSAVLIHHFVLFFIDAGNLVFLSFTFLRIGVSSFLSSFFILLYDRVKIQLLGE